MNATITLELPAAADFADGDLVVIVTGIFAGIWECVTPVFGSQWTGSYATSKKWVQANGPAADAMRETADLAASALLAFGGALSSRAVFPGPSALADKVLRAAMGTA